MQALFDTAPAKAPEAPPRSTEDLADEMRVSLSYALKSVDVETFLAQIGSAPRPIRKALSQGETPLHILAGTPLDTSNPKDLITKLLYFFPEALREKDGDGLTPLHIAARAGLTDNVVALIDCGADAEATDNQGWTALFWAVWSGVVELVETLLQKLGVREVPPPAEPAAARPALIEQPDGEGRTPFMVAARHGHTAVADKLLALGANINARDNSGQSALMAATMNDDLNAIEWLIEKGADVNLVDRLNITPLYIAAQEGDLPVVRKLLDAHADPKIETQSGHNVLFHANYDSNKGMQLIRLFQEYGYFFPYKYDQLKAMPANSANDS